MKNNTPWDWDVQRMCGDVMGLVEKNCEFCALYLDTHTSCGYIKGYFNGFYPANPPPVDWFIKPDGQPLCTARRPPSKEPAPIKVANVAKDKPGLPPIPKSMDPKKLLVFDTINRKLFFIDEIIKNNYKAVNFTVNPANKQVADYLKTNIYHHEKNK